MRPSNRLALLAVLLFTFACAYGQETHYNYDRGTNFAAYKTYQWVDIPGGTVPDQLVDQSIKRAIGEQLAQKGLTKVEKNADVYLGYQAVISVEKSVNLSGSSDGWGGWGGFGGWRSGSITGQTGTIPVGVLLVDVYDPARKQLIWRGDVGGVIDLNKDPDKNYRKLQKGMTKLFKNYPPQRK